MNEAEGIEAVISCPACGAANRTTSRFCKECGAKLQTSAEAPVPAGPSIPPPQTSNASVGAIAAPPLAQPSPNPPRPIEARASQAPPGQASLEAPSPTGASQPRAGMSQQHPEAPSPATTAGQAPQPSRDQHQTSPAPPPLSQDSVAPMPQPQPRVFPEVSQLGAGAVKLPGAKVLIPAVGAGVVILAFLVFLLLGPGASLLAPTIKGYANREVQVMSSTDPGANVLGQLRRGDQIAGKLVKTRGGQPAWLKVKWPGQSAGYVWRADVSARPRPDIDPVTIDSPAAGVSTVVYSEPDVRSPLVDDLAQGEPVVVAGNTRDGWSEIALNGGGVGYVRSATFDLGRAEQANIDASPSQLAALNKISHYVCTFSPDQSKNAPEGTGSIAFYLDESRYCLNHRYAYLPDQQGGLKRLMFDKKTLRASLLYFMPDRRSFYRTDYGFSPSEYAKLLRKSGALEGLSCAPPADPKASAALQAILTKSTPPLDSQSLGSSRQRRVWQCAREPAPASGPLAMR